MRGPTSFLERNAQLFEPVDGLAALVGVQTGHLRIDRTEPLGMRHEPVVDLVR